MQSAGPNLNVIFEDSDVIVVEKSAGVPSQGDKTGDKDMVYIVSEYLSGKNPDKEPYAALIHRLDRTIGGVMVFGKNKDAAAELSYDLLNGNFDKTYLAVVCGKAKKDLTLRDYLVKNERLNYSRVAPKNTPGAREALLSYELINRIDTEKDGALSLISIKLFTGRHHQIRVQLSNAKTPIWGDMKYNEKAAKPSQTGGFVFAALWAYKLKFKHPKTGKEMEFETKPHGQYPFTLFFE